jgi:ABC-type antimicrobial peptide transport system ATPase subunit
VRIATGRAHHAKVLYCQISAARAVHTSLVGSDVPQHGRLSQAVVRTFPEFSRPGDPCQSVGCAATG